MMIERYPNLVPQGISAELISEKWGISRRHDDDEGNVPDAQGAHAQITPWAFAAIRRRPLSPGAI